MLVADIRLSSPIRGVPLAAYMRKSFLTYLGNRRHWWWWGGRADSDGHVHPEGQWPEELLWEVGAAVGVGVGMLASGSFYPS